jgi:hypothetical protein
MDEPGSGLIILMIRKPRARSENDGENAAAAVETDV